MARRKRCWLCDKLLPPDKIIVGLGAKPVCRDCDKSIERRPGKVVGREIRDGLKAMRAL